MGDIVKDRADWLLDAVATSTQDRQFLRGDEEYNDLVGGSILLNGEKAMRQVEKDAFLRGVQAGLEAAADRVKDIAINDYAIDAAIAVIEDIDPATITNSGE